MTDEEKKAIYEAGLRQGWRLAEIHKNGLLAEAEVLVNEWRKKAHEQRSLGQCADALYKAIDDKWSPDNWPPLVHELLFPQKPWLLERTDKDEP
jgi:hypothetical protein